MTEKEYDLAEGIRRSDLWRIRESPEKYRWFSEHPHEQTPALVFGTAVHKLLLEPDGFESEFAVTPVLDRRTKEGKELWNRFLSENEGKTVISQDDFNTAAGMVEKALTVPAVRKLMAGKHEEAFFWVDEDTELTCKVRLDMLTEIEGRYVICDYKTAACARTEAFNQSMFRHGYHLQAFMYSEAVMKNLKLDYRPNFFFIAQEKRPPYSVNVIRVTEDVMTEGWKAFRDCIGTLAFCQRTGYFYGLNGPYDEANETYVPGYISMESEEEV